MLAPSVLAWRTRHTAARRIERAPTTRRRRRRRPAASPVSTNGGPVGCESSPRTTAAGQRRRRRSPTRTAAGRSRGSGSGGSGAGGRGVRSIRRRSFRGRTCGRRDPRRTVLRRAGRCRAQRPLFLRRAQPAEPVQAPMDPYRRCWQRGRRRGDDVPRRRLPPEVPTDLIILITKGNLGELLDYLASLDQSGAPELSPQGFPSGSCRPSGSAIPQAEVRLACGSHGAARTVARWE